MQALLNCIAETPRVCRLHSVPMHTLEHVIMRVHATWSCIRTSHALSSRNEPLGFLLTSVVAIFVDALMNCCHCACNIMFTPVNNLTCSCAVGQAQPSNISSARSMSSTLAGRAAFPAGLRVLLVDSDSKDRAEAEQQLRGYQYDVQSCPSVQQLISVMSTPSSYNPDVVIAELELCSDQLKRCINGVPLVVISRSSDASSVMRGIAFGASEVLQKPLCNLKLKNIWQHTVRKLMNKSTTGKQTSQGSNRSGQQCTDPYSCSANSSQLESGSLASSAANLKLDQEAEQDVQSTRQRSSSNCTPSAAAGDDTSSQASIRSAAPSSSTAAAQRAKANVAVGIPHSGPFMPLASGLTWGFPRDLTRITTPLQMPTPPPLPFPVPPGMPMPMGMLPGMPPPLRGMLPPFPFPPMPFALPGMPALPGAAIPTAPSTTPAAAAAKGATTSAKAPPPMIPTPSGPAGTSSTTLLLPTSSLQSPTNAQPTPASLVPPFALPSPHSLTTLATDLDDLDGLLPSFPGVGEVAEDLEEHPLTKACAAEDLWVTDLPLSSSPVVGGSLLSSSSCYSEDNVLGLTLKKSSSFADLINESLCFA